MLPAAHVQQHCSRAALHTMLSADMTTNKHTTVIPALRVLLPYIPAGSATARAHQLLLSYRT